MFNRWTTVFLIMTINGINGKKEDELRVRSISSFPHDITEAFCIEFDNYEKYPNIIIVMNRYNKLGIQADDKKVCDVNLNSSETKYCKDNNITIHDKGRVEMWFKKADEGKLLALRYKINDEHEYRQVNLKKTYISIITKPNIIISITLIESNYPYFKVECSVHNSSYQTNIDWFVEDDTGQQVNVLTFKENYSDMFNNQKISVEFKINSINTENYKFVCSAGNFANFEKFPKIRYNEKERSILKYMAIENVRREMKYKEFRNLSWEIILDQFSYQLMWIDLNNCHTRDSLSRNDCFELANNNSTLLGVRFDNQKCYLYSSFDYCWLNSNFNIALKKIYVKKSELLKIDKLMTSVQFQLLIGVQRIQLGSTNRKVKSKGKGTEDVLFGDSSDLDSVVISSSVSRNIRAVATSYSIKHKYDSSNLDQTTKILFNNLAKWLTRDKCIDLSKCAFGHKRYKDYLSNSSFVIIIDSPINDEEDKIKIIEEKLETGSWGAIFTKCTDNKLCEKYGFYIVKNNNPVNEIDLIKDKQVCL